MIILMAYILGIWGVRTSIADDTYNWTNVDTGCNGNTAIVGELTSPDFPQDQATQNALWASWKETYPGLVDTDRLGNATKTYNCHAYIFCGNNRWLNDPLPYKGNIPECWKEDNTGTIRSEGTRHSCTAGYTGKCGNSFLQLKNNLVYGPVNPIYKKVIAPIPIPALSEWKQIFSALLFLAIGILFIRKRQASIAMNTGGSLHFK